MVKNSPLCYGVYTADNREQVGFTRVITDFVRFSWLADVFILPLHRKKQLGKRLIHTIVSHPKLKGTCFMLATADAHGLYSQYGFHALEEPKDVMIREADMAKILEGHGLA
ncbi:GNAT family N-acetyltransferase [Terrilactibacillus sp. S3-3]|nr:GNAT family N-acetyltransferase [Terrilactibacillus sp. S3-3]